MTIESLGYIGFNSERLDEWADFGVRFLGLQLVEQTREVVKFRMDDHKQRIVIRRGTADTGFTGWEVSGPAALSQLASRLDATKVSYERFGADEAGLRGVSDGIRFHDPAGGAMEAFHGSELSADAFTPGRSISGFRTGPLGVGHVVYQTPQVALLRGFYEDVLGFGLSDYFYEPFHTAFYHVNSRHHSLAVAEAAKPGIHHVMIELNQLDDVGQGYDLARAEPGMVATTLGRHINDLMTSYYARSPDGFFIEYGWGGRSIDPATWRPFELAYGPSLWGHDRDWLGPDELAATARLRGQAAQDGLRQPVQVADGNYQLGPGACAWWERTRPQRSTAPGVSPALAEADAQGRLHPGMP